MLILNVKESKGRKLPDEFSTKSQLQSTLKIVNQKISRRVKIKAGKILTI